MGNIKYYPAAENEMFPPEITMFIRFAHYEEKTECALCNKKRKKMWTMLVPFKAGKMAKFTIDWSDELSALTPVCDDHGMKPTFISLMQHCDEANQVA